MVVVKQIESKELPTFPLIGTENKVKLEEKVIDLQSVLIEACKRNDEKAQRDLYAQYAVAMFNTCKRMLGNREDAQDVLQESFIDAFRSINQFKARSTFGAWLKRIVINKCINHLNRQKLLKFEQLSPKSESVATEQEKTLEKDVLTTKAISEAINQLPLGCRSVFVMKAMEGYDHKEIAQYLQISVSTSKSQYSRARQLLRESLIQNVKK